MAALLPAGAAEAHNPPFFWMPDLSVHNRECVEHGTGIGTTGSTVSFMSQTNLYIELAISRNISVMGRVPIGLAIFNTVQPGDPEGTALALGNISAGAQFARTTELEPGRKLLYGVGVLWYLPMTVGVGLGPTEAAVTEVAPLSVPDAGRFLLDTSTLRMRGSVRMELGSLFFQTETVVDRRFVDVGEDHNDFTFGLGAGYQLTDYLGLLTELSLVADVTDTTDDNNYSAVIDAGVRYHNPQTMISLRAYQSLGAIFATGIMVDAGMRY